MTYMDKVTPDGSAEDLNIQYGYTDFKHHWKLGSSSKNLGFICKGRPGNHSYIIINNIAQSKGSRYRTAT